MSVDPSFVEALFYVSLIILAPVFFKLSRILTRYLLNRFVSTGKIVVVYKRGGLIVSKKTIRTTAYVVDQLKASNGGV